MPSAEPFLILLAEDDPDQAALFAHAVLRRGGRHNVRLVRDGAEAIAYLSGLDAFADRSQFPLPALLVLDLHMPRKNGLDVLEWVRKEAGLERLPIILLTSSDDPVPEVRARALGVDAYVRKPSSFEGLDDLIGYILAFVSGRRPEVAPAP
jgi:CheY-like chemotaxis protein